MQEQNSEYPPIILPAPISKTSRISTCTAKLETGEACNKPLGAETKQYNAPVCKDHRICSTCEKEISLKETEHCFENSLHELKCARCLVAEVGALRLASSTGELTNVTVTQKDLDELNNARLLITADLALSDEVNENDARIRVSHWLRDQSFDQQRANVKKLQAVAAEASLLMQKDKRFSSEQYKSLRAKDLKEKQILISAHEDRITAHMAEFNLADRDFARKHYAKHESQLAKKTAKHFEKQAKNKTVDSNIVAGALTGALPQISKPPVSNMTPEEKKRKKAIEGLMHNLKCSYEYAAKTLDNMSNLKDKF